MYIYIHIYVYSDCWLVLYVFFPSYMGRVFFQLLTGRQVHTTGMDILTAPCAKAVVTIGKDDWPSTQIAGILYGFNMIK